MSITEKTDHGPAAPPNGAMGAGSWLVLIVLLSFLAATLVIVYLGWTSAKDANVSASAYVAMALGVTISLAVGFGLMALIFYSSRKGYDEPPILLELGATSERDDMTVSEVADDRTRIEGVPQK